MPERRKIYVADCVLFDKFDINYSRISKIGIFNEK